MICGSQVHIPAHNTHWALQFLTLVSQGICQLKEIRAFWLMTDLSHQQQPWPRFSSTCDSGSFKRPLFNESGIFTGVSHSRWTAMIHGTFSKMLFLQQIIPEMCLTLCILWQIPISRHCFLFHMTGLLTPCGAFNSRKGSLGHLVLTVLCPLAATAAPLWFWKISSHFWHKRLYNSTTRCLSIFGPTFDFLNLTFEHEGALLNWKGSRNNPWLERVELTCVGA